ncbi:MAG: hypothetical protein P8M30_09860, partial [Planctomycetaceae bacterium]|nr:hypothetical protein [Planctomycetaceae bacterium]
AISRGVEDASTEKATLACNVKIAITRTMPTTCSRVWKMPGQGYGTVSAKSMEDPFQVSHIILAS